MRSMSGSACQVPELGTRHLCVALSFPGCLSKQRTFKTTFYQQGNFLIGLYSAQVTCEA